MEGLVGTQLGGLGPREHREPEETEGAGPGRGNEITYDENLHKM